MRLNPVATLLALVLPIPFAGANGQAAEPKMAFVIDSIPVVDDPEVGDDLLQGDISDMAVVRNKDSLKMLGYEQFDGVTFVFTKEYRSRPEGIRQIPSTKKMVRRDGVLYYRGIPYNGPVIDYYFSGKKQGSGRCVNGKADGVDSLFYQNGHLSLVREYKAGVPQGVEREYYSTGSLRQEGLCENGKEEGVWKSYFPNGVIEQYGKYRGGELIDSGIHYYSSGKIRDQALFQNGKLVPDRRQEKLAQWMKKSNDSYKEGDIRAAINYATKAIEIDSTYADAWFSRATLKLNDFKFDDAIADFDKTLSIEPYMMVALTNRAFARIRKYQFAGSRSLSKHGDVDVRASPDKVVIPQQDNDKICSDLKEAVLLGEKLSKMITEAFSDYCHITSFRF